MNRSVHPIHPGVFIKEELEARNWSQRDLAFILGCPEQSITQLITGKRGISPQMAKALAKAFDVSPELFSNLQQTYDLAIAQEPDIGIEKRKLIQTSYPAREMIKRGWLSDTKDPRLLEAQLIQFFDVRALNQVPHLRHAAKKTYYDEIPSPQLAWMFRVRNLAKKILAPKFSPEKMDMAINQLKNELHSVNGVCNVTRILTEAGVRIVFVEPLPNAKIDGVCLWLDRDSPVIGLSLRYDRIDNFWFCLFHEIAHIIQKDGIENEVVDIEITQTELGDSNLANIERTANKMATDFIIDSSLFDKFVKTVRPFYSKQIIIDFAAQVRVHPGIVAGRLQNLGEIPYSNHRPFLEKIRSLLSGYATLDGWGIIAD